MEEQWLAFCPFCGTKYETIKINPHTCSKCGREYYINPHPCNAAIVENSRGEILFVRRRLDPKKGMWDLPGGFMNLGETAEESLRREIAEELTIPIHEFSYFSSAADRYLYKDVNYHTLCFFYRVTVGDKPMKASDDITSYSFISKKNIPFGEVAFDGIKKILKEYLRQFPTQ